MKSKKKEKKRIDAFKKLLQLNDVAKWLSGGIKADKAILEKEEKMKSWQP
jgi:hypothetical protein